MNTRNMTARNLGLYSRDIEKAAKNALRERQMSFGSIATISDRFRLFLQHVRSKCGIKDLRWITNEHLVSYASHVARMVEEDELKVSTAHNYVSAVNTVMTQARQDRRVWVSPSAFLPKRSFIAKVNKAPSPAKLADAESVLSTMHEGERFVALLKLGDQIGLRLEEMAKANPRKLLKEAKSSGRITVTEGTKGGRPRSIPITSDEQIAALRFAENVQGKAKSLIPKKSTYEEFRGRVYRAIEKTSLPGWHCLRVGYAQRRYHAMTGVEAPVALGVVHGMPHIKVIAEQRNLTEREALQLDRWARTQVARELGHHRRVIRNAYLG